MIAIALIVTGIIFLCMKRVPYGKKRELRGPLVALVCLLMIVPSCIFIGWGVMEGIDAAKNNRELDKDKLMEFTLTVELPSYGGILLLSWLIVATNAGPVQKRNRHYDDDDEDVDDRRREPNRRSRYDDFDDDEQREEDYGDRPRRRDQDDDDRDRDRPRRRDY